MNEEIVEVWKTRLSKIRKWSKEEQKSMIGTSLWTSKGLRIEFALMSKGHLFVINHREGMIFQLEDLERRLKNPVFWNHKVLKFENGIPVEIDDEISTT